ncbi:MAG TPA: hypothetical protein VFK86_21120 [Bauldia sp.]|nr:hypothetical protein [Bauldia sp.]
MNSLGLPARRPIPIRAPADPSGYVARRLSSLLLVPAAVVGGVAATVLDGAGVPVPFSLAIGLVLFVAVATLLTSVAARGTSVPSSETDGDWLRVWSQKSQLGPDPEQVIGRHTGARI